MTTIWVDEPLHRAALAAQRAAGSSHSLVDQVSFEVMRREGIVTAFAFDTEFETQGFARPAVPGGAEEGGRLREGTAVYQPGTAEPSDLVSIAEIAARAARPVNTIQSWRRRNRDFPEPLVSLAAGPVWTWPVVERWIEARRPPRRASPAS